MSDKEQATDVYTVEKLLKERKKKGKTEYFVKWKDWSAKFNSWEPEENILDVALVEDFRKRQENKKHGKKRSSGGTPGKKAEKATPEQPPAKKPRRLAGGDIRDESSESSDHEEESDIPSTSGVGESKEDEKEAESKAAEKNEEPEPEEQDSIQILEDDEHEDAEGQNEDKAEYEHLDEGEANDDDNVASEGDLILLDEEEPEPARPTEADADNQPLNEEGYLVGHMTTLTTTRDLENGQVLMEEEAAFIVGLTEAEAQAATAEQQQIQMIEQDEETRRIEEIKHELRAETWSMVPDNSTNYPQCQPNISIQSVTANNKTVQIVEF